MLKVGSRLSQLYVRSLPGLSSGCGADGGKARWLTDCALRASAGSVPMRVCIPRIPGSEARAAFQQKIIRVGMRRFSTGGSIDQASYGEKQEGKDGILSEGSPKKLRSKSAKWTENRKIKEALVCYKKMKGLGADATFTVPTTYSVPSNSPSFPKPLWGFPLGRLIRKIVDNDKRQVKLLKALRAGGLVTRKSKGKRAEDILEALRCYRSLYPTRTKVPSTYVVPEGSSDYPAHLWGMKLGDIMRPTARNRNARGDLPDKIKSLGFTFVGHREEHWNNIMEALRCYRSLHPAKTRVPASFVIPEGSSEYPDRLWGLKLGQILSTMILERSFSEKHDEVEALGYKLKVGYYKERIEDILEALRCFRSLHPLKTRVPTSFEIPEGSSAYPERLWGLKLGQIVNNMVHIDAYKEYHGEVEALGFTLKTGYYEDRIEDILEALRCFRSLYPFKTRVTRAYVVPEGSSAYPERLWGLKLGQIVSSMIVQGFYKEYNVEVEALGFTLKTGHYEENFSKILEALQCYRSLHPKNKRVPISYKIPEGSSDYPERLWGLNLGTAYGSMVTDGTHAKHHDEVEALGFSLTAYRHDRFEDILEALRCYRSLYPTHSRIPQSYKVPEDSSDYPAHVWGLRLGRVVTAMIKRGYFGERHHEVEALGFTLTKIAASD